MQWRINLYDYIYNAEFRIPDSSLRRYLKHRKEKGINYLALHDQVAANYYKQGDFLTLRMDVQKKEWNDLKEGERNSMMWPDFLLWHEPHEVEIRRPNPNESLGLVTITVQDQMTGAWYNITKYTKENHLVHDRVKRFEWIFEVDMKTTNCPSDEFSSLIKNGKNVVWLSLKKAVDPLSKFQKNWGVEKSVTLKLREGNDFKKRLRLHHFYSKKDNENIKDHILVSEIKLGADPETSEPLYRGDELLAVNDHLVKGKKLAEIYGLIFCKVPAVVTLTIKEIQCNMCNGEGMAAKSVAMAPEIERHLNSPDTSMLQQNTSSKFDYPTQLIVVEKETNEEAGRIQSEAYVNSSVSLEDSSECENSQPSRPETTGQRQGESDTADVTGPIQETSKTRQRISSFKRRVSLKGNSGGNKIQSEVLTNENKEKRKVSLTSDNVGYIDTPPPSRRFSPTTSPTTDKMCGMCVINREEQLPDDRDKWPIDKIEHGCFQKMCELIDLSDRSKIPLMSALSGFSNNDADSITQEFTAKGGRGIAKKALGKWGASDRSHNVGALKEILQHAMQRVDVILEIERWEKMSVCHGCGLWH